MERAGRFLFLPVFFFLFAAVASPKAATSGSENRRGWAAGKVLSRPPSPKGELPQSSPSQILDFLLRSLTIAPDDGARKGNSPVPFGVKIMRNRWSWSTVLAFGMSALVAAVASPATRAADDPQPAANANREVDERAGKPDSYYYYGPHGLWKHWQDPKNADAPAERLGRDTWIHWTWGNQKFLRRVTVLAGNFPVPISIDFFRLLDSRKRGTRFRDFGVINEPNCEQNDQPDEFGLYLDRSKGDPLRYYPGEAGYTLTYPGTQEAVSLRHYGRPTGVVGLRLFPNRKFD